jgi:hypothetical protein
VVSYPVLHLSLSSEDVLLHNVLSRVLEEAEVLLVIFVWHGLGVLDLNLSVDVDDTLFCSNEAILVTNIKR